ncbi:MAG: prenyltransferase/squalene oxidase repeat-containing protein, partial [Phycisphaerae bacterium]
MRRSVCLCLAAGLLLAVAVQDVSAVTDRDVVKAIEKGQNWLKGQQGAGGSWPEKKWYHATGNYGHTEIALFTLVYTGIHPNRPVVEDGLKTLLTRNLDWTYAISMRCMAYAYIQRKLSDRKRDTVRKAMKLDALWLCQAQGSHGGWDYKSLGGSGGRYDLSNTQMAILALREAALAGCEIPEIVWRRAQGLYFRLQQKDGSWNYGEHSGNRGKDKPGYGSMTAAGLASIFITMDNLNLASGCPCRGGRSKRAGEEFDRRVDAALLWLEKHFDPRKNPKDPAGHYHFYWLYSVERVGIAAGYKYFGDHNWFQEGAEYLVKSQKGNGAWGQLHETCFSILFLYKGRAPVLYNKLEFEGI